MPDFSASRTQADRPLTDPTRTCGGPREARPALGGAGHLPPEPTDTELAILYRPEGGVRSRLVPRAIIREPGPRAARRPHVGHRGDLGRAFEGDLHPKS